METVELIPAHFWQCNRCGAENFARSIVADLSPEEMLELKLDHGIDVLSEGHFLTKPEFVTCVVCRTKHKTLEFGEDDE